MKREIETVDKFLLIVVIFIVGFFLLGKLEFIGLAVAETSMAGQSYLLVGLLFVLFIVLISFMRRLK